MANIDLHMHSNYSTDGEFSPQELVDLCLAAGLTHAAIADHNTVRGVEPAQIAASGSQLSIIPAIEMDCTFNGVDLHLLGYGIDHTAQVFFEIEQVLHKQEQDNSELLMHLVRQVGIEFDNAIIAELVHDGVVTGEMIAEAALSFDTEAENPLLDPYRNDGHRSDNTYANFYWDYCAQGKPAFTPMNYVSLSHAIEIIQSYGGVPVLAHPGLQIKENSSLLAKIIAEGVAGLEVYSTYHTQEQVRFYREAAQVNHLLVTCGSDFHGKAKQSIIIGDVDPEGQEEQIITALFRKLHQS